MKRNISRILLVATSLFAFSASASFIPVPTSEEAPLRLFVGIDENNNWNPASMRRLEGKGSVVFGLGSGFDIGLGVHGGVHNGAGLFKTGSAANGMLGGDVMIRFLGNVTDSFFLGIQGQAGYTYDFSAANITAASHIPLSVGLAFGLSFIDMISIYLFPALDFGGKTAAETAGTGAKIFGSLIGLNIAVGTWINLGGTYLSIEAKPRFHDVTNMGFNNNVPAAAGAVAVAGAPAAPQFSTDFMIGLGWDL